MSKAVKIWLIIAAGLVIGGSMIFAGVMSMLNWNFTNLSTSKYETNTYEITENFTDILISTNTAHIEFLPSETEKASVVCKEYVNEKHTVSVKDGVLSVEVNNTKKWYEYIGINFGSPKITVYLPENEYGSLNTTSSTGAVSLCEEFKFENINVDVSTGAILVEKVSAEAISLTVSTGNTTVTEVNCKTLTSSGSTGSLYLKNVVASQSFSLKRSTGDIKLENCDAAEITIKTSTGDVKGSLLSDKVFIASASTGKVEVPKTTSGGKCEITTSTGDIKITVE